MTDDQTLNRWFCREVLPLERSLMRFIRRNWRNEAELIDLRQEIYERVLVGARRELPLQASQYVYTVARNHLINRARRERIVSFDFVADLENVAVDADALTPERHASGREELRRVLQAVEMLPPQCGKIVRLRKVEGLSSREVSQRLGIGINAVDQQTMKGMRALANFMLTETSGISRNKSRLFKHGRNRV